MMIVPKNRISLNKTEYSVRSSQLILQNGTGSMIDFSGQTLMVAAPEYWDPSGKKMETIHDERLEKQLHVSKFCGFPREDRDEKIFPSVAYVRFPEWFFCPSCRRFQPIGEWKKEYLQKASRDTISKDPDMNQVRNLCCLNPQCKRTHLSPISVVSICDKGHISDFPWIEWTHAKYNKPVCAAPALHLQLDYQSNANAAFRVSCQCEAHATLVDAFGKDAFQFEDERTQGAYHLRCSGYHPWKHIHERCSLYPRAIQKGSSAAYFPYVLNSLVIPPFSSQLTSRVQESRQFENCMKSIKDAISDAKDEECTEEQIQRRIAKRLDEFAKKIALEICEEQEKVHEILERRFLDKDPEAGGANSESVQYFWEEYQALSGRIELPQQYAGDFMRESMETSAYHLPYISGISLISKLREVKALIGFTRGTPLEHSFDDADSERIVCIKKKEEDWYPAYEAWGEGVFIEFDPEQIRQWMESHQIVQERAARVQSNYQNSFWGKDSTRKRTAPFILLHTIAHLLIKQLSFSCGYPIASLQERIYCSDAAEDGVQMQGILIYTSGGDSEGTLGGLVRQGMPDTFPSIFREAMQSSCFCSNDPVCSLSEGQGRDSLNLSACYSCTLIPETSCSENNCFLDRSMISGMISNRNFGFYAQQLFENIPWKSTVTVSSELDEKADEPCDIRMTDEGCDCHDISYSEIWSALLPDAGNNEKILLKELLAFSFDHKEKPAEEAEFESDGQIYTCDLFWKKSGLLYFSECRKEEYLAAKQNSKWICVYAGSPDIHAEDILHHIKED